MQLNINMYMHYIISFLNLIFIHCRDLFDLRVAPLLCVSLFYAFDWEEFVNDGNNH